MRKLEADTKRPWLSLVHPRASFSGRHDRHGDVRPAPRSALRAPRSALRPPHWHLLLVLNGVQEHRDGMPPTDRVARALEIRGKADRVEGLDQLPGSRPGEQQQHVTRFWGTVRQVDVFLVSARPLPRSRGAVS